MATAATQPVDVLKTRMMNAKPGEYKVYCSHGNTLCMNMSCKKPDNYNCLDAFSFTQSIMSCFLYTARTGPFGFFKVSFAS